MKYFKKIAILAVIMGITLAQTPVYAAWHEEHVNGRFDLETCRIKKYVGNGTLKIESIPQEWGFPGYVYLWGDVDETAKLIKSMDGVTYTWEYPEYDRTLIMFGEDGGSMHLSGQMDVWAIGGWIGASSRGNFDITTGVSPYCIW